MTEPLPTYQTNVNGEAAKPTLSPDDRMLFGLREGLAVMIRAVETRMVERDLIDTRLCKPGKRR